MKKNVQNGHIENPMEKSDINDDRRYDTITVEREGYSSTKSVLTIE